MNFNGASLSFWFLDWYDCVQVTLASRSLFIVQEATVAYVGQIIMSRIALQLCPRELRTLFENKS